MKSSLMKLNHVSTFSGKGQVEIECPTSKYENHKNASHPIRLDLFLFYGWRTRSRTSIVDVKHIYFIQVEVQEGILTYTS